MAEVLEETLSADGRLPKTLLSLLVRPGHLTVEWTRGRRQSYTHPFRVYLFAALLFFLLWPLSSPDESLLHGSVMALTVQEEGFGIARSEVIEATAQTVMDLLPLVLIVLLVPTFAVVSRMVIGRRGDYLATHVVFSLHAHTVLFALLLASQPFRVSNWIDDWALLGAISLFTVYVVVASRRAFPRSWSGSVVRVSAALLLYFMMFWATVIITAELVLGFTAPLWGSA